MPVIEVNWRDIERLLGKSLSYEEIEKYLPMLKCEIEEINDEIIVYEATHDRPDLFSTEGLSRALKGLLEIELGLRKFKVNKVERVQLIARGPEYRPYVLGAVVRNLRLDDEALKQLMNLQEKLHVTYCRNRRKVSIGIYDLDTIELPIYYEKISPDGIKFTPLNETVEMTPREILYRTDKGREYAYLIKDYKEYPLLIDSQGQVLSLPPIINSEDTKVTENTKNVFIDVTGTELELMMKVLTIITTSIAERGSPEEIVKVDVIYPNKTIVSPRLDVEKYEITSKEVSSLSGIDLGNHEIIHQLRRMRHDAFEMKNKINVAVAPYRVDILHNVDLIEDILMAYDYERIIPEILPPTHSGKLSPIEYLSRKVKDIFIGLGFQEIANYMMSNPELLITSMRLKDVRLVEVENPKMEKYTVLRNWLIPGLLNIVSLNKHLGFPIKIFEIGDVVIVDEKEEIKVRIERHVSCIISGYDITMTDILVICKAFLKTLNINYKLKEEVHPSFIEGRCAEIIINGVRIGILGEIHPEILNTFDIPVPTVALEINLNPLIKFLS